MHRVLGVLAVLAACSEDPAPTCDKDGGKGCFTLPTAALVAHPTATTTGPPALGCGALVAATSTHAVTINGSIVDYANSTLGIAAATLSFYSTSDYATPIATTMTAGNGTFTLSLPTGTPDILFTSISAANYVDIYGANLRPDLTQVLISKFDLADATPDYLDQLYGLVRSTRDMKKASMAVSVLDCQRHPLEHAIAVVSLTSGMRSFITGTQVFYTAAGNYPVPELQSVQMDTNDNGDFAALNIPVDRATYLQIWGFPDDAAFMMHEKGLVLIAEYPLTLFAGELLGLTAWVNQ